MIGTTLQLIMSGIKKGFVWVIAGLVIEASWEVRKLVFKNSRKKFETKERYSYGQTGTKAFDEFARASARPGTTGSKVSATRKGVGQSDVGESK